MPATADALTVLALRSRGVNLRKAVDAVFGGREASPSPEPRHGGEWSRPINVALKPLRSPATSRRVARRLFPKGRPAFPRVWFVRCWEQEFKKQSQDPIQGVQRGWPLSRGLGSLP